MSYLRKAILTGLGSGYLPASGTWGSAISCVIFLAIAWVLQSCGMELSGVPGGAVLNVAMSVLLLAASVACVRLGRFAEQAFGKKDPGQVNVDEVAGQSLALLLMPIGTAPLLVCVLTSFAAFRFFDILKPPPCRRLEKYPFGWGVLLDDLMAGVYANIVAQVLLRFIIPKFLA